MSKKPRTKKRYHPRAVAVPPYLASLDTYDNGIDHREDDRIFLLQVANRTVDCDDLFTHVRMMQATWLLASRMEDAKSLRECLHEAILAIGAYVDDDREKVFTPERFEALRAGTELCRSIFENSGHVERAQAVAAVLKGDVTVGFDDKPITDEEIRL